MWECAGVGLAEGLEVGGRGMYREEIQVATKAVPSRRPKRVTAAAGLHISSWGCPNPTPQPHTHGHDLRLVSNDDCCLGTPRSSGPIALLSPTPRPSCVLPTPTGTLQILRRDA